MPIETFERLGNAGAFTKLGDVPPQGEAVGDASSPAQTGTPAAPDQGNASPAQPGETSAPPSEPPGGTAPGQAGSTGTAPGDDDDDPEPEVATVDFVAKRIKRLTARQRAQEREYAAREAAWAQERAHLQGQLDAQARLMGGVLPEAPQTPTGPPQSEEFQRHDDYVRATARFEAQQVQQQQTQQAQLEAQQRALMEREQAFRAQHADFDERIHTGLVGKVAPHVQQALMLVPDGPALAYTLATQPETLQRLNQLPPPLMLLELGRLAAPASLPAPTGTAPAQANGTPPARPTPPLPPPLTPVSGQGPAPTGQWHEGMSMDEFKRYRQQTSTLPVWKNR